MKVRNTFIIFIVSGFWHGANWTFIVWGFLNALYFLPLLLMKKNRINTDTVGEGRYLPTIKEFLQMSITFFITVIAWVFFRADSIGQAFSYIKGIFDISVFNGIEVFPAKIIILIIIFILFEWLGRKGQYAIERLDRIPPFLRYSLYSILIFAILVFSGKPQEFIYFQF